jgi:hypothetical protein
VLVAASAGTGTQEFRYVVLPNVSRQNRSARITIAGATHRIDQRGDDDDDDDDDEIRVEGAVAGLSGACPALRFAVAGSTITTSERTEFRKGPCKDVANGVEVEVRGSRRIDGTIAAERVELKK